MPVAQRRVQIDRSLAANEQEDVPRSRTNPASVRRYASHTNGAFPSPTDAPLPPLRPLQATRRTDDVQYREGDYAVQTEHLPLLERHTRPAITTQAVPTTKTSARHQRMQDPVTQPARSVRRAKWWHRLHPATKIGIVACTLFLAMELALNSATWFISSWADPATYIHRSTAIVTINGHKEQVHAFMSQMGQVDLLVVPDDASKSRVIVGAQTFGMDPTRVMFAVEVHGSLVVVETLAPREMVAHLYPAQDVLSPCVFDLKGGK